MSPTAGGSRAASDVGGGSSASPPSRVPSKRAKILRRTVTGGALGGAVALLVWIADATGTPIPVLACGALLAAACAVELVRMPRVGPSVGVPGVAAGWLASVVWAALGLVPYFDRGATGLLFALVAVSGVSLLLRPLGSSGPRTGPTLWATVWATLPLPLLAWVYVDHGTRGLVALIVLSKIGDIAGYYVGSAFGKHHPFKRLSPGKTTEGCLGSLVAGGLAGALFAVAGGLPGEVGPLVGLAVGLSINLAAQAGDLLESYVKRTSGVKDSSTWLGASGGFLDVTDSLLLSVPVALLTWSSAFG